MVKETIWNKCNLLNLTKEIHMQLTNLEYEYKSCSSSVSIIAVPCPSSWNSWAVFLKYFSCGVNMFKLLIIFI